MGESHILPQLWTVLIEKKHIRCMLKLTRWSTCENLMQEYTHTGTLSIQSEDAGVERVVFVWNEWTPSYFSSHISLPPPPFASFISSLLSSHPLNLQFSHLLWAASLSGPLPFCKFISFHSSLLWQLVFLTTFACFHPLVCSDIHTRIQRNVRNVLVPAASCCCYTYDCNPRTWGVWVFFSQSPWMDGWMEA